MQGVKVTFWMPKIDMPSFLEKCEFIDVPSLLIIYLEVYPNAPWFEQFLIYLGGFCKDLGLLLITKFAAAGDILNLSQGKYKKILF
jgi:hypothetical protein